MECLLLWHEERREKFLAIPLAIPFKHPVGVTTAETGEKSPDDGFDICGPQFLIS